MRGRRSTQESLCRTVKSSVTKSPFIHFCCSHFSQTFCMSSAINIAWGKRDAHGWTCPCGERLSIIAAPDIQSYELHCKGKKHPAGIAPATKGHQTSMVSCLVPTKCMGVLPLGVSSALVLRGCYPLMRHAHEKVHWFYVDGVGCFSRDPPCTREARVDESGNPIPCIPCEALPRDNTLCKWMREERTADSGTVHWKLGFLKLAERAAGCACKRCVVRQCAPSTYTHTHHHTNTQTVVPLRTNLLWQANVAQRSSTSML